MSGWQDNLDERQRKEVALARIYAADFAHGTDGHNRLLLIAKLADLLDEAQRDTTTAIAIVNGKKAALPVAGIFSYEDIVWAAFPNVTRDQMPDYTVTYRRGRGDASGIIAPGEQVMISPGMIFNVAITGNA